MATMGGQMGGEPPERHFANMAAGSSDHYVPRSGSPSHSIVELANAGDELADRRGTVTTTDWSLLTSDEIAAAGDPGFEVHR